MEDQILNAKAECETVEMALKVLNAMRVEVGRR